MDIVKQSIEWAKDEVFSSLIFIFFGSVFVLGTLGFWQLGKTEVAKAFIYPTMVAGAFLLMLGIGMFFSNKAKVKNIDAEFEKDAVSFVQEEIKRTEKTMGTYQLMVFKVFPAIAIAACLLMIFVSSPIWRGISITLVALFGVIFMVDSNANARLQNYHSHLKAWESQK